MDYRHYKKLFFYVLAVGFAVLAVFRVLDLLDMNPIKNTPLNTPVAVPEKTTTYTNTEHTFSLAYPKEFSLANAETVEAQQQVVIVTIPRSVQPKTNFSGASVGVAVQSDEESVQNCLIDPNGVGRATQKTINGTVFSVSKSADAGAGNYYDSVEYRAVHNNSCYVITSVVHSTNIGNYSPDQGITVFDAGLVTKIIDSIVTTFHFL